MKLEQMYQKNESYNGTKVFSQLPDNSQHKYFYKNFKFLYLYERYKEDGKFDDAYIERVQSCYDEIEDSLFNVVKAQVGSELFSNEEVSCFIEKRIVPLYLNKYSIYPITSISYIPLRLRLYVYYSLYLVEDNEEAKCHLRNRLSVTLSRLNEVGMANNLALYNWVIAQSESDHFSKVQAIQTTLRAIVRHHEKYQNFDFVTTTHLELPMAEIYCCYTKLLKSLNSTYSLDNVMCLDLLALYYQDYAQISVINNEVKEYLRNKYTLNLSERLSERRMDLIRDTIHLPSAATQYIMPKAIRLQLQLYDELIKLMM